MAFRLGQSGAGTNQPLLRRWGLKKHDLSRRGRDAFVALEAERAELAEKLQVAERLAVRDPLTGALNRRGFLAELYRTMSEVERYGAPAAVLYVDLDGFKALNDAYGHAAGDAVLKQIGRLLMDQVRESDAVGRLGGDEFGLILTHASAEEARAKGQALGEAITSCAIVHVGVAHRVNASIGVHAIAKVEEPEAAIARADEAMYAEKHARKATAFASF